MKILKQHSRLSSIFRCPTNRRVNLYITSVPTLVIAFSVLTYCLLWPGSLESKSSLIHPLSDAELNAVFIDTPGINQSSIVNTTWVIELNLKGAASNQNLFDDTLIFEEKMMRSTLSLTEGFPPAEYSFGTKAPGQLSWVSIQHHPDGASAFWHGELQGEHMTGALDKKNSDGLSQSFTFVGTLTGGTDKLAEITLAKSDIVAVGPVLDIMPGSLYVPIRSYEARVAKHIEDSLREPTAQDAIAQLESAYKQIENEVTQTHKQIKTLNASLDKRNIQYQETKATLKKAGQERSQLAAELADVKAGRHRLETEAAKLRDDLDKNTRLSEEKIDQLDVRLQTAHRQLSESDEYVKTLENKLTAYTADATQARNQLTELQQQVDTLTQLRIKVDNQVKQLQDQLEIRSQEGDDYLRQQNRQTQNVTQLKEELSKQQLLLIQEKAAYNQKLETLRADVQGYLQLQTALNQSNDQVVSAQRRQALLEQQLAEQKKQRLSLASRVAEVQEQLKSAQTERDEARASVNQWEGAHNQLQEAHLQLKQTVADNDQEISVLRAERDQYIVALNIAAESENQLEQKLSQTRQEIETGKKALLTLKAQKDILDQARHENSTQQTLWLNEKLTLNDELNGVSAALSKREQELTLLQRQLTDLQSSLAIITAQRDNALTSLQQVEQSKTNSLDTLTLERNRLQEDLLDTKQAQFSLQTQVVQLKQSLQGRNEEHETFRNQLLKSQALRKDEQERFKELKTERDSLHVQLTELRDDLNISVAKQSEALRQTSADAARLRKQLEDNVKQHENEINKLQTALNQSSDQAVSAQRHQALYEQQLGEQAELLELADERLAQSQQQLQQTQISQNDLNKQHLTSVSKVAKLQEKLKSTQTERDVAKAAVNRLGDAHIQLERAHLQLKQTLADNDQEISELRAERDRHIVALNITAETENRMKQTLSQTRQEIELSKEALLTLKAQQDTLKQAQRENATQQTVWLNEKLTLNNELNRVLAALFKSEQELTLSQRKLTDLQGNLTIITAQRDNALTSLQQAEQTTTNSLDTLTLERNRLQEDLLDTKQAQVSLQSQVVQLKQSLQDRNEAHETSRNQLLKSQALLKKELIESRATIKHQSKQLAALKDELSISQTKAVQQQSAIQESFRTQQINHEKLATDLNDLQSFVELLENTIKLHVSNAAKAKRAQEELHDQLEKLQAQLDKEKDENEQLQTAYENTKQLREQSLAFQTQRNRFEAEAAVQALTILHLQHELETAREKQSHLQEKLKQSQNQIRGLVMELKLISVINQDSAQNPNRQSSQQLSVQ